jgi:hypothetical protein
MKWRPAAAWSSVLAILAVVVIYVFVGSVGRFRFRYVEWWESAYPNLAEGFLMGKLSLALEADPRLAALPDPYDANARAGIVTVHDSSYYKGKFYLYYSPLPVLLVYIPVKVLAGRFPADAFVGTFFAVCAFLAQAAFVIHALRRRKTWIPTWMWIAFVGLANVTTFILVDIWMYEVAILCAMAFASLWAYSLLRFVENPTVGSAVSVGLFLALAIVSRPTLVLLGLVTLAAFLPRWSWRRVIAAGIPLLVFASAYAVYNFQRFGSPFELGHQYVLSNVSLRDRSYCGLCSGGEVGRFFNTVNQYVFRQPAVNAHFPFVALNYNEFDPAVIVPAKKEELVGVFAIAPLLIGGVVGVLLLWTARVRGSLATMAMLLMAGGWLMLLALSTCGWFTARYELEFLPQLLLATVLAVEETLTLLADRQFQVRPLAVTGAVLALYSILLGFLLGFTGRTQAFNRFNPELFQRISSWFGPSP